MPSTLLRAPDKPCAAAVDLARDAVRAARAEPGEHLSVTATGERLVTHHFAATVPGYGGWHWAVTVSRAPRAKNVTVCETWLEPGEGAVLAPEWLPWSERLAPGDLGVGDLLPTAPDDDRLAPAYLASDDPAVEEVALEVGLGRVRVMSRDGRTDAAERWYGGGAGPAAPLAEAAPDACVRCGFFLPLAGALRAAFGVCGNEYAPDDGRVVAVDHGCGAHSEAAIAGAVADQAPEWPSAVHDDVEIDLHERVDAPAGVVHSPGSVDDASSGESSLEDDLGHG